MGNNLGLLVRYLLELCMKLESDLIQLDTEEGVLEFLGYNEGRLIDCWLFYCLGKGVDLDDLVFISGYSNADLVRDMYKIITEIGEGK